MTAGDARLDAIQARLDAASDGPMDAVLSANRKWALVLVNPGTADERTLAKVVDDDDAWLYANAPADMAFLLAELREAREALTRVEAIHRPASVSHTKYNGDGTLISYTKTEDGPCIACYPAYITQHCEECEDYDETCGGVTGPAIHPWACPTAAAVAAANGDGR